MGPEACGGRAVEVGMDRSSRRGFIWLAAVGAVAALAASAHADEPSRATRAAAVVVVEATVAQVFEAREGEVPDYVVELAIERVELLGGTIRIDSRTGAGTTVRVAFPLDGPRHQ